MKYNILRNNNVITMVRATGSLTEKLFGEETLTLDFTLPHFVLFRIGDAVEVYGKTYYISQEPVVNKKSTKEYVYNLVFNGGKYRLAEVQYFFYDENNELNISEFSITATAQKMVELLVANANRTQTGWSVGRIDSTETKTIDFSDYNCLAALTRIAEDFGLEFWVDADKSIHLEERKKVSGYTLEYGKSKGLKGITRNPYTESSLVTRLYARGSSRNIPKNYRNGQKFLRMPVPFLEKNTDKYGIVEHTQPFEDIYPKRVGTVTQVYADNPLKFTDSTLDFDLNEYNEYGNTIIQKGISAKIIFQTGDLAGYTLEVKEYGFDSVTKTFTLLKNQEEKSFDIPSDTFRPQVGDKYIIIDIAMPKSYVDNAEQELQAAAQDYLDKNSKQRFIYAVEPDPIYLKNINFNLKLGHTIRFKDSDFGLDDDIRAISITRDINNPYDISFEIAEQATITQIVRNYIEKEKAQTAIKKQQKYNAEMARRSFLFAEEIKNNVFDNEGYFDAQKIKPLSIETGMLSVGSRMQQFSLPNIALSITSDNKRLHNTAGQMVHLTIDPNAPRTWNLAENTTVQFSDNFNFIYIKADKIGSNATIVVTEQKILFDSDPIFYFFLAGNVSSIINGVRRIKTSYGYTQITPSEITTGRIASPNGSNYIDLKQDGIEINAKVTFASNSPAIQQAVDAVSVGGRNYLRGSQKGYGMFNNNGRTLGLTQGEENGVRWVSGTSVNNGNFYISTYFHLLNNISVFTEDLTGQETIQSMEVKPTHDMYIGLGGDNRKFCPANVWTKIENSPYNNTRFMGIYAIWNNDGSVPATAKIYHRNWKLEKGNKATDWTPAPEDIQQEIMSVKSKADQIDNLGTMAWQNSVEKAMLGSTIVQGGYIKTELLNASAIVSNGGGATTSQLNSAISSIVVGGRNYIKNASKGYGMFNNNGRIWEITQGEENGVRWISGTSVNNGNFSISTYFHLLNNLSVFTENLTGQETIQSMEVKPTHDMYIGLWENNRKFCPANVWTKIENSPYNNTRFMGIYAIWNNDGSVPATAKIYHRNWKLEKGNKATDWTPAPEDLDTLFANLQQGIANMQTSLSDVKTKTDNFSSIQGGLMMANLMSVGSNQANQNAFISGITDEGNMSVRFGAGANYANKHNAPFRVLDNGKMIAQDADITGRITATGGNIGDWEINGSSFRSSSIGSNDSWAQYSNYALFSPETFLIRKNGSERGETKEVMMGITSSVATGSEGAAAAIKNNIKKTQYDFDRNNVALRLEAKNGVTNTALDILNGDIRVGGEVGYTGELFLGGVWLTIRKGIITNYS
ncbi:phage tail protein [Riemerella anatipestifer]|uniref:phage tail protein n=1 Tax=Riemerella anatipestifer TaxID=34085 RepID=UPI0030BFE512